MSRQCPKCGTDHPTEARQCGQCGLPLQGSIKDRLKWLRDDEGRARHIREEADRVKSRELAHQQEEMVRSLEKTGVPAKVRAIAHQVCDDYLRTHDTDAYVHEVHSSDGIYLDLIWNQRRGSDKDWGFDEQIRGGSHLRFHIDPDHTIDISAGRGKRSVRLSCADERWPEALSQEILACLAGRGVCDWSETIQGATAEAAPEKWEYATLIWDGLAVGYTRMVSFTHRPPWTGLEPNDFNKTLWRLGEAGWELVSSGSSPAESFANQARSLFFERRLAPRDGAGVVEGQRTVDTVAA